MNSVLSAAFIALSGVGLLLSPMAAHAMPPKLSQIGTTSGVASVPLSYNGPEMLNLSALVSTGTTVAFPMGGGSASGIVSIQTQYSLNPGRVLTIEAGFASPTALSDSTGDIIPAFAVSAGFSTEVGFVTNMPNCMSPASGQTAIMSGLSCGWITYPAVSTNTTSANNTDTISLSLNPAFAAAPGAYSGTLLIAAQAN